MEFDPEIIKKFKYDDIDSYRNDLGKAEKFLKLKQNIGENWFFLALDEENIEWKLIEFGFSASNIQLSNDSSELFMFSWDGSSLDGILLKGELISFNQIERKKIYIKNKGKVRIWSY